jgi:predicted enzyme related to lactoylglutathione lyase
MAAAQRTTHHGAPAWYELGTSDLGAAHTFYRSVLGWSVADSGMEGFDYHLATAADGGMVAGMMSVVGMPATHRPTGSSTSPAATATRPSRRSWPRAASS